MNTHQEAIDMAKLYDLVSADGEQLHVSSPGHCYIISNDQLLKIMNRCFKAGQRDQQMTDLSSLKDTHNG